jgi:WD40 repeat protein
VSDVFLSYSRRDQEVVRRLHGALADAGREAWVDWQGIPPTAEWMAEVRAAVDAADAFVVVLSPDWAASPVCREEAEHAAARGKRIVPVVVRDTDAASVPVRVAALNWIFLRDGDDFEAGVATLLAALDLDLDWVHGHTRLLVRAGEWEARGRERSLLLRGRDLQAAEALLASAGAHRDPAPTPLQGEYVQAGREAERRSGRIRTGVLAAGLVGALVLAAFAVLQLFRAEDQTRVAEGQAKLAQARELTAAANSQLTTDPELSVLLARSAIDTLPDQSTDEALRKALGASRVRARYIGHEGEVRSVAYSADGSRLVSGGADGTVRLWDTTTRTALHVWRNGHGDLTRAVMSPDGSLVAAGTQDGWVTTWDATSGTGITSFQTNDGQVLDLEFSPDGHTLITSGMTGVARLWDTATWSQKLSVPPVPLGPIPAVAFAGDGRTFVTGGDDRLASAWDAQTGALLSTSVGNTSTIYGVAANMDGSRIATAGRDETARVFDAATGLQLAIMRGTGDGVNAVAFSPDGGTVATAGADGLVRLWDPATGSQRSTLAGHGGLVWDLAFDPTGRYLTTAGRDGTIRTWALEPFEVLAPYVGHAGAVPDGRFSPDGTRVVTAGADSTALVSDTASGQPLLTLRGHESLVISARFSHDGTRIVTSSWDGTARVWDAVSGAEFVVLDGADNSSGADFSPDGQSVVTFGPDGTVRTWGTLDGHPQLTIQVGTPARAVLYSPDGAMLIVGGEDGRVTEWDAGTGSQVHAWAAQQAAVISLAVDPGGSRLATLGAEGAVSTWDAASGERQLAWKPAYGYGWSVALSPDGTRVATGGDDGAAHVWDAATGELLADIPSDPRDVESVAFAPNGTDLLLTGRQSAELVRCDLCGSSEAVRALANKRVTRDLTPAERAQWLHEASVVEVPASPDTSRGSEGSAPPGGSAEPSTTPSSPGPQSTDAPSPTLAPGALCTFDAGPCQVEAGHYTTSRFQQAISFDLPAWILVGGESPGSIAFSLDDGDGLALMDMAATNGRQGDSAIVVNGRADDWLAYLRAQPLLHLGPVEELTVDGHPAKGVSVTRDATDDFILAYTDTLLFNWTPGETMRFVFVDVGGSDGGLIIQGDHLADAPMEPFDTTFDALVSSIRFTAP